MGVQGLFITVEGIEGSGKSTQVQRLAQAIRAADQSCLLTREPGGTPLADRIRAILLDPQEEAMDAMTELFLYSASRRQHVIDVIRPALDTGAVVLSDRFTDATLAYQGFGRLLNMDLLRTINRWATDGTDPDVTFLYDLPENIGLERARSRNRQSSHLQSESRLEGEDLRFHRRVREGYLSLAVAEPDRFVLIDASGSVDEVFQRTVTVAAARIPRLQFLVGSTA